MRMRQAAPWVLSFCVAAAAVSTAAGEGLEPPVLVMFEEVEMSGRQVSYEAPVASAEAVLRGHQAHFFKNPMFDGAMIAAGDEEDAARAFCGAAARSNEL